MAIRKPGNGFSFGDVSDDLANNRLQFIDFYHLPSDRSVQFKAFLTDFEDGFRQDWVDEEVYGRMDPISKFKRTKRVISLAWDIPSNGIEEAVLNLERCSLLMSMLYPDYDALDGGASRIKTDPLMKLRFMNLIQNSSTPGLNAKEGGLLGHVEGFSYKPDLNVGFFDSMNLTTEASEVGFALPDNQAGEMLLPKTIKMSCKFTVIHQHALGWKDGEARDGFDKYPYGAPRIKFDPPKKDVKTPPGDLLPNTQTSFSDRDETIAASKILLS